MKKAEKDKPLLFVHNETEKITYLNYT